MGWQLEVLEGVAATASEIGSGVYNVLSSTPLNNFLVDNATLEALKQISGTEIAPLVNDLGETIGYVGRAAASSNGSTALSTTWMTITRDAQVVTQELIDAAIPLVEGGTTADLQVGQEITRAGLAAGAGVGGAAGTGVGSTALATVAGPAIAVGLGVAAGVALYELAPEFWTEVSDALVSAGKTIGGKVISFFKTDGTEYYDEETINIIKQALTNKGYLWDGESIHSSVQFEDYDFIGIGNVNFKDSFLTLHLGPMYYSSGSKLKDCDWFVYREAKWSANGNVGHEASAMSGNSKPNYASDGIVKNFNTIANIKNAISFVRIGKNGTYTTLDRVVSDDYCNQLAQRVTSLCGESTIKLWYGQPTLNVPADPLLSVQPSNVNTYNLVILSILGSPQIAPSPNTLPQEQNDDRYVSPIPTSVTDPIHNPTQNPNQNPNDLYDPTPTVDPGPEDNPSPDVDPDPQPDPETEPAPDPHPTSPTAPQDPTDPNPPGDNDDDSDPEVPPVVIPMAASALSKVFNPTQAETDALGQYLWSSTNIEDILKLFQNPIDGIIGFMKLYATPVTGSHANIKLGYLDSGVSAAVVTQQIATVDCGSITIPGDKANATDYPPYTTMQIYLPFIGIEPLNAYDLVGSQLAVRYRVDCYTGACIAQLKVTRDNLSSVLYEFSGNCAQQIPLTSGNFLQLAGNIISGAITGGVHGGMVGAAIGAGSSLIHSNVEVGRSGNLSANAGMLGCRVPYVIITRAVSADAANYRDFYGYPANKTVYLKNCSGYTRVKDIILHTSATQAERNEIEQLLKTGIII